MSFREAEIALLRAGAMQKTASFLHEMRTATLQALQEDASRQDLNSSPDEYVLRSNNIVLGMADAGAFELADLVYQALDEQVQELVRQAGKKLHRGALLANRGLLNIQMRRYDEAVPLFLYVAEKIDPDTYGVAPEDSYANTLRRRALDDPALELVLKTFQFAKIPAQPPVSKNELDSFARFLGQGRFVLFAALLFLRDNIRVGLKMSTVYTPLRILDSLRVFAFQIEEALGRLAVIEAKQRGLAEPSDWSNLTLLDAFKALFCGPVRTTSWWPRLQREIDKNAPVVGMPRLDAESERLQLLAECKVSSWEDVVVSSLALLHLVRNITAHQIYPPAYIITAEANLERVIAWLAMSGVAAHREAFRV